MDINKEWLENVDASEWDQDFQLEDEAFAALIAEEQKELANAFPLEMPDSFYGADNE